jgi:hypothetical protein
MVAALTGPVDVIINNAGKIRHTIASSEANLSLLCMILTPTRLIPSAAFAVDTLYKTGHLLSRHLYQANLAAHVKIS